MILYLSQLSWKPSSDLNLAATPPAAIGEIGWGFVCPVLSVPVLHDTDSQDNLSGDWR